MEVFPGQRFMSVRPQTLKLHSLNSPVLSQVLCEYEGTPTISLPVSEGHPGHTRCSESSTTESWTKTPDRLPLPSILSLVIVFFVFLLKLYEKKKIDYPPLFIYSRTVLRDTGKPILSEKLHGLVGPDMLYTPK